MVGDILASSRRIRRKRFILKASLILLFILILLGGVIGFFHTPKFRIREISVEGTISLEQEQFKRETQKFLEGKYFKIFPYDNIFILPEGKMAVELSEKFPLLKKIVIKHDFSQKLSVAVEERKAKALWCGQLDFVSEAERLCAFLDETGFIFQPAPNFSGAIFLKFFDERKEPASPSQGGPSGIGKMMIDPAEFKKIYLFAELLAKKEFAIAKIILKDAGIYEFYLKDDWYILLNDKNEPSQAFSNLELVLEQTIKEKRSKIEYIDLRFGKKVFYKLK